MVSQNNNYSSDLITRKYHCRVNCCLFTDQVFFLEQGKITGAGTHEELIAIHDLYREFTHGQGFSYQ